MSRTQLVMIVLAIAIVGAAISALLAQGPPERVTLCHKPPDNPENAQTLIVPSAAVEAHLAHGDTLGPCPVSPTQ